MSSRITTHVLYLGEGIPAAGLQVSLGRAGSPTPLASAETDADGRIGAWPECDALDAGDYWLKFDSGAWFTTRGEQTFYPAVEISFTVDGDSHFHVPLLLNAYGYTTYRGS